MNTSRISIKTLILILFILLSSPSVFSICDFDLNMTPDQAVPLGETARYRATVKNRMNRTTFDVNITSIPIKYWSGVSPDLISLDRGEEGLFLLDIDALEKGPHTVSVHAYSVENTSCYRDETRELNVIAKEVRGLFQAPGLGFISIAFLLLLAVIYLNRVL